MIIALTYDKNRNVVEQYFGDCESFLLYDTDSHQKSVIDNGGNSHKALIPYLKGNNVDVLICGGIGAPAVELFGLVNIKVVPGIQGDADQVLTKYFNNELTSNSDAVHNCGCGK